VLRRPFTGAHVFFARTTPRQDQLGQSAETWPQRSEPGRNSVRPGLQAAPQSALPRWKECELSIL